MYKQVAGDIEIPGIKWLLRENGGVYHAASQPSRGWVRSISKQSSNLYGWRMGQCSADVGRIGELKRNAARPALTVPYET
jgi:hypothetical protein